MCVYSNMQDWVQKQNDGYPWIPNNPWPYRIVEPKDIPSEVDRVTYREFRDLMEKVRKLEEQLILSRWQKYRDWETDRKSVV